MDVPGHPDPLIITDAAVNIAPTLEEKVDIVQNAIDLANALHLPDVRVAVLSAMETVNPKVQSSLEAASLSKMAERGQITGGVVDGPLALDNAINEEAAATKKSRRRSRAAPMFWSCRISRRAICSPKAFPFSPVPIVLASYLAREFQLS